MSSASIVETTASSGVQFRGTEGAVDWLLACPRKDFFVPIRL